MKNFFRIALAVAGITVLIVGWQIGSTRYAWTLPFGSDSNSDTPPTFELLGADPVFDPDCEFVTNASGGGYGMNLDLEFHTLGSNVIVEGVARVSGPARFSGIEYLPRTNLNKASGINTPFTIKVSDTYKGPEKTRWEVSESGGQVGCFNYQLSSGQIRLFDGAEGLFFISGSGEFVGDSVRMAIVENGPEWYLFTDKFGSIDDAVELILSLE
jgi:hypothetical protein